MRRLVLVALAAVVGYAVGWVAGALGHVIYRADPYPFLAARVPLPHHVPPAKGGAALRFAMVHDILHERYPRHGRAYHAERVRVTRQKLDTLSPDDPATFPLIDDLAVALARLGQHADAAALLEDKLRRQLARNRPERERYTTYANLGTVLSAPALGRRVEGLALVRKSVEVNPNAHFGREKWQAAFDAHRLTATHAPYRTDAVGNALDLSVELALNREVTQLDTQFGRPTDLAFSRAEAVGTAPAFFEPGTDPAEPARWDELRPIRDHITRVGPVGDTGRGTVPFDEPTVAIVGIWRQVSGPDPHLALALGETMLRVGQRHLAWAAFERARRLSDAADLAFLRDHCRARQAELEQAMTTPGREWRNATHENVGRLLSAEDAAELRPRFDAELAHGEAYQRAYQEYEAKQIAAGVPLDDPHFADAFHAGRETIASAVGPEEWFAWVPRDRVAEYTTTRRRSWGVVGAGLLALLVAAWGRLPAGRLGA